MEKEGQNERLGAGIWLLLLLVFIPYATFNYLPASWAFGKMPWPWLALAPLAGALFISWVATRAWEWGLGKYQGSGTLNKRARVPSALVLSSWSTHARQRAGMGVFLGRGRVPSTLDC